MSSIPVRCAYCGQMTKQEHCGFYKGVLVHNKPDCDCLQAAIKSNFFVAPRETKRWNTKI